MSALTLAKRAIIEFESLELQAYPDPGSNDGLPWTIGYGNITMGGVPVQPGDTVTKEKAEQMLDEYLHTLDAFMAKNVPDWGLLSEGQAAALLDFAYNVGEQTFLPSGTGVINRIVQNKLWDCVSSAMLLYVKGANGKPLAGLKRRRVFDAALFAGYSYEKAMTIVII